MNAQAVYDALIAYLDRSATITDYWNNTAPTNWDSAIWTGHMTAALVAAVSQVSAGTANFVTVAKGNRDIYGRSEYLNIDVMGLVDDWSLPAVAIEHENNPGGPKLRYCLWKLMVIGAPISILVCYVDSSGTYGGCFSSAADLCAALAEVSQAHPARRAHLIVGEWNRTVSSGWAGIFSLVPV